MQSQRSSLLLPSILLSIFITFYCQAQENYLPGSIVTLAGDTVKGMLDYRNWNANPEKISFRPNSESTTRQYTQNDILAFLVANDIYRSVTVEVEMSPHKTKDLQYGSQFQLQTKRLFLRALFDHAKGLYIYHAPDDKELFFLKQDSTFTLLLHKKYLKELSGSNVAAQNNKYLGQLASYLQDCPSIQSKLKTTKYTKISLEKLFSYYYSCIGEAETKEKNDEHVQAELGLVAGAMVTSLKFSGGSASPYLASTHYSTSFNFIGGVSLNLVAPRNNRKWSIYNELVYGSFHVNGTYTDIENPNWYTTYNTEFGYSFVKLNNMVRYRFPVKNFFIFINGGIFNAFGFSDTNYKKTLSVLYSSSREAEGEAISGGIRKYEFGFILGMGAQWNNLTLEMRGESGNGVSQIPELSSHTTKVHIVLGYRFH